MFSTFFARLRRRPPLAAASGQDEAYAPVQEGVALLGVGADQLRAYLVVQPGKATALEVSCLPLRERLTRTNGVIDGLSALLPHSFRAAISNAGTIWDALFTDLIDATRGGPGISTSPLMVLMSAAISQAVRGSEDNTILFVSSDARSAAATLSDDIPGLDQMIADLLELSRAAIGARAAQLGLESVLVHRRFRRSEATDAVLLQQLENLRTADLVRRVADTIEVTTLSVWSTDIGAARAWSPAADPASSSVIVLSVRVPVASIWLAPRREGSELLISAEALSPEHSEVITRD